MQLSKMKNIIVLKGMASNVVKEAIVVLKPNVKIKQSEYNTKGKCVESNKDKKMIVVKEAESTINTYVKKLLNETEKEVNNKMKNKYKFLQILNVVFILIIILSFVVRWKC